MKRDEEGSKTEVRTPLECGCVPAPPRTRMLSALQTTKLIRLHPNRPIIDDKPGRTKVQKRCQVNRNKYLSDFPENRSSLSARKSTDCRNVKILNYSPPGSVLLSACVVVFVSVAFRPNIQSGNVTDGDRANILVVDIFITRCYMTLTRKNRRLRVKKELDQQQREPEQSVFQ